MKKLIYFTVIIYITFNISHAFADFNEYVLSKTQEISKQFAFSDLFVDNAKNCIPIEEKKQLNEIETIYKIKGLDENNKCVIETEAKHQTINVTTICKLDKDTLQIWYDAQLELKNTINSAKELNDILFSDGYLISVGILMDENNCISRHSAFDPTEELRNKLQNCEPYKYTLSNTYTPTIIEAIIQGYQNNKCLYELNIITKPLPQKDIVKMFGQEYYEKMKNILNKEQIISIKCQFNEETKNKYIKALAKTALPEGNAFDFDAMQKQSDANEKMLKIFSSSPECSFSM